MTKIPSVEEVAKELLVRASYVTGENGFEGAERFAYQLGFQDALGMVYIELTGNHKSKGTLTADRTALLTELRDSGLLEEDKNIDGSDMKYHFRNGQNSKAKAIKAYIRTLLE